MGASTFGGHSPTPFAKSAVHHPTTGEPIKVLSAGFICVYHSPMGLITGDLGKKGDAGPAHEQLLLITAEARVWAPDLIFGECSHQAGSGLLLDSLKDMYGG